MTRLHCACALRHLAPQCHTQTCCEKFGVTLPPTIPFHWPLPVWQCAQSTFCHSSCDHGSKDTLPQTKQTRTMLHHWVTPPPAGFPSPVPSHHALYSCCHEAIPMPPHQAGQAGVEGYDTPEVTLIAHNSVRRRALAGALVVRRSIHGA